MNYKYIKFLLIAILMTFITSCGDAGLAQLEQYNLKKIAIISVRSDSRMHTVSQSGSSEFINVLQDVSKGSLKESLVKDLTEDEQFFLFNLMESLKSPLEKWVKSKGITILSEKKVLSSKAYKNVPESVSEKGTYYSIPPYRNIEQPTAEVLSKIAEDLGVDALVTFRTYFEREAYRDALQLPFTPDNMKLFAKVDIMVFDKLGKTIYQKRFEGMSPEIIGFNKSTYQFSFQDKDMTRVIKKTVNLLKENVKIQLGN